MKKKKKKPTWDQISLARLHDKIKGSNIFLALVTENWKRDPEPLLQLGFAMMLEKPIYLTVPQDAKIPRALERIADGIERYVGPEDHELAVMRIIRRARANGHV